MSDTSKLDQAITQVIDSLGSNLSALSASALRVTRARPVEADLAKISQITGGHSIVHMRCRVEGPVAGMITLAWPLPAAISLAGGYKGTASEDVSAAREMKIYEGESETTFAEVAVLMVASIQEAIQGTLGPDYLVEVESHELVDELVAEEDVTGGYYAAPFAFKAYELSSNTVVLYVPLSWAETIEGGPVSFEKGDDDEFFDDFEPAEIRGAAAAYVNSAETVRLLRRACRRVGLTLNKRPKSEVPNPACYSKIILVVEIGLGQSRRYDWCRRIKQSAANTLVLLLIHEPTKSAVARAYCSNADGILRTPTCERELSKKLKVLLDELAPEEATAS